MFHDEEIKIQNIKVSCQFLTLSTRIKTNKVTGLPGFPPLSLNYSQIVGVATDCCRLTSEMSGDNP